MADSSINEDKLRILFITQDDPFYIRIFFEEFLKSYRNKVNILGVVICPTMGKKSLSRIARQMFDFYGLVDFLRMLWRLFWVKIIGCTLQSLVKAHKVPVFKNNNVNGAEFIDYWRNKDLDVIVSIAAPQVFKKDILELPRWGCLNIHHAKLPFYRGMLPNFWQMYHGEKKAGITVHRMNPKIDEGEIILQREVNIGHNESLDTLIRKTKRMGAQYIMEALRMIRNNAVTYLPNSIEKGSYFTFPAKEDVLKFRRQGKRIL